MWSSRPFRGLLGVVCVAGLAPVAVLAQSAFGNLAGDVTDTSGAVVGGAKVQAKNETTGQSFSTVSSGSGSYRFGDVPLGRYDVTVTATGFSTAKSNGADVTINNTTTLTVVMRAGEVSTNVTVDASAPALQTQTSDINGTVNARQIIQLPLALGGIGALRSPEAFVFLLPGTTGPGTGSNNNNGEFFSKISGGQSFGNEVLLDGVSQQRSENGSSFDEEAPSVEALSEFKVTTATPSAEFGRTTGGIESFATKQGTDTYHGTVYLLFKNDIFDANTWFNNGYKASTCVGAANTGDCRERFNVPGDKKYDYGGTFGGPIRIPHIYDGKDKSFFFYSWEQFQQHLGGTPVSTVPTAAERTGDFSGILGASTGSINPCTGQPILQNQIFDPATTSAAVTATNPNGTPCRLPFPNNAVPTNRSPANQKLAALIPAPNLAGQTGTYGVVNNFAYHGTYSISNTTETIRGDQVLSQNDRVFGSYSVRENNRYTGQPLFPFPVDSGGDQQDFITHFSRGGYDHTFSANVLNHFLVGLNRSNSKNFASALIASPAVNYTTQSGIGNVVSNAFPLLGFDGLDGFGNPTGSIPFSFGRGEDGDNVDNALILHDGVDWQLGRNSLQFGGEFRFQQFSLINQTTPNFVYSHNETTSTNLGGAGLQSGNSYASFLLGDADSAGQNVQLHAPRWNSKYLALYVEDNLKVSNQLTLNLGVRYSIDFPRLEAHNETSNFSFTAIDPVSGRPGAYVFGNQPGVNPAWADTYYKDISPRIGFAYTPAQSNGKTVFRGGFDILYAPLQYSDFGGAMQQGYSANPNPRSPDAFTPAFQVDSGFPTFARTVNLNPGQMDGGPGVFNTIPNNVITSRMGRPAAVYNWSFQMQQQVAQDLIFTIGYIGQAAQNLRSSLENVNNMPLADIALGDTLTRNIPQGGSFNGINAPFPTFTGQVQHALRPFPQYDFIATDCCLQNVGHSSYEALIASLARQFRNGLNLQLSYTFAKNETDADSILPGINAGVAQDQDVFNHRLEKSVSTQNIPNTFVASYLYELPVGKGKAFLNRGGISDFVLGGWEIGGIQRYQSGQPFSFGCATGIPGYQNCIRFTRDPNQPLANPAYAANKHKANLFSGIPYFNPKAFIDPNATALRATRPNGAYELGTGIPRVTEEITSPLWITEDFSLIKNFPIKEGASFQLKVEALDAFNRHNFSIPDQAPNDGPGRFGVANATDYGPRNLQITGRIDF